MTVALMTCFLSACSPETERPNTSQSTAGATPDHSLRTFVAPPEDDHFGEPAGLGTLRICRSPENSIRGAVPIATGTIFSDVGVIDQPPERGGGWWLLWVQTTETVALSEGQDCVVAPARVVPSEVPANYADMQSLTRFTVADRRFFEILSDGENLDRYPALLLMNATAQTDFRGRP